MAMIKILNVIIGLVLLLPFLNYLRYPPLGDWWTDSVSIFIISLALILSGVIILVKKEKIKDKIHSVSIPVMTIFGISWLIFISLSSILTQAHYPIHPFITIYAIAIGAIVYWVMQIKSLYYVLTTLSAFLLMGALIQSFIGLAQATNLAYLAKGFLVYDHAFPTLSVFGNFAQRNQFAHYLAWGLVSACYLYSNKTINYFCMLVSVVILALFMTWSSSRLVVAYGFIFGILTLFWNGFGIKDVQITRFSKAVMYAVMAIAISQLFSEQIVYFLQWIGLPIDKLGSGAERMMESGFGGRRRIEWAKAWDVFMQHPWLGVGFGGYAYQSLWLESLGSYNPIVENGLFVHCHNLIMQLLAETGVIGTLLVLIGGLLCVLPFFKEKNRTTESLSLISFISITFIHSMFEYPLWYLPFLSGLIIFLSLSPVRSINVELHYPSMTVSAAMILGCIGLFYVFTGYKPFFNMVLWHQYEPKSNTEFSYRYKYFQHLSYNPFWAYDAENELVYFTSLTKDNLVEKIELMDRLVAYRPYPYPLLYRAIFYAYDGQTEKGKDLLLMLISSFPAITPDIYAQSLKATNPEVKPLHELLRSATAIFNQKGDLAVVLWARELQKSRHPEAVRN